MFPSGTDAGAERPVDPNLAKALSHPLRQRILERLNAQREASPNELAGLLEAPLGNVAYHVQVLLRLGLVELARTRQRRGALEHYYRATAQAGLDPERWARLPASFRRQAIARTLHEIVSAASDAGIAGGFDSPQAQVRRLSMDLDPQGWHDVALVLDQALASIQRIQSASAARAAPDPAHRQAIPTDVAVLLFRRAPHVA